MMIGDQCFGVFIGGEVCLVLLIKFECGGEGVKWVGVLVEDYEIVLYLLVRFGFEFYDWVWFGYGFMCVYESLQVLQLVFVVVCMQFVQQCWCSDDFGCCGVYVIEDVCFECFEFGWLWFMWFVVWYVFG